MNDLDHRTRLVIGSQAIKNETARGNELSVGSICTGYGGLDLAFSGLRLSWVSEIDPAACQVLDARYPTTPNIGDIYYAEPEKVDIVTAGFPCQDLSNAGKRQGLGTPDEPTRSGLWWRIRDVISSLRPRFVVLENVPAILTTGGSAVIGSLTEIGYDTRWATVRASDIGACHRRERWFCVAWDSESGGRDVAPVTGPGNDQQSARPVRGPDSPIVDLLPTPTVGNATGGNLTRGGQRSDELLLPGVAAEWAKYGDAIASHERLTGRECPPAALAGRLNPVFVEFGGGWRRTRNKSKKY